jgi:hypothetical protein
MNVLLLKVFVHLVLVAMFPLAFDPIEPTMMKMSFFCVVSNNLKRNIGEIQKSSLVL